MRRFHIAVIAAVAVSATLTACSSGQGQTGGGADASSTTATSSTTSSGAASAGAASGSTWNGTVSGSDQMKVGTDYAYAAEIQVTCSGTPGAPTALVETTEGWKDQTSSPAGGFGASEVTITSPSGTSATWPASTKQGPIWNSSSFTMLFNREEQVGSETWKLWLGKVSCLGG